MKRFLKLLTVFCLVFAFVACSKGETRKNRDKNSTTIIYNNEVEDAKYLKAKLSEATSIYYKSNDKGEFGDDKQVFMRSIMPSGYTELEYLESNGNQYIDTGVTYKETLSFEVTFQDYNNVAKSGGIFGFDG